MPPSCLRCSASYKTCGGPFSPGKKKTDAVLGGDMALFHLFSADTGAVHGYASSSSGQVPSLSTFPPSDVNTPNFLQARQSKYSCAVAPRITYGPSKTIPPCCSTLRFVSQDPTFSAGRQEEKAPAHLRIKAAPSSISFPKTGNHRRASLILTLQAVPSPPAFPV